MLNGGALNSYAVNNASKSFVVEAASSIYIEVIHDAYGTRVKPSASNVEISVECDIYATYIRGALSEVEIAVEIDPLSRVVGSASTDIEIGLFISPRSSALVFSSIIIEFSGEAIPNSIIGNWETSVSVDLEGTKSTKVVPAEAETTIGVYIDPAPSFVYAYSGADIEIEFVGFFSYDFGNERATGAYCEIELGIDADASVSPKLVDTVIEFTVDAAGIMAKHGAVDIQLSVEIEPLATKVLPASTELIASVDVIDPFVYRETFASSDYEIEVGLIGDIFHEAFAGAEIQAELTFESVAYYILLSSASVEFEVDISGTTKSRQAADADIELVVDCEFDERFIRYAEQIFADISVEFIVSPIPGYGHSGVSDLTLSLVVSDACSAIFYTKQTVEFSLYTSADGILALQGGSDVELSVDVVRAYTRLALQGGSDVEIDLTGIEASPHLVVYAKQTVELSVDIAADGMLALQGYSVLEVEVSPVDVEAVIGIYEPAAECRTIYVEPDDNVLYIPYEERQIDIAC